MKNTRKIAPFVMLGLSYASGVELPYKLGDLKTLNGREYHDVTITRKTSTGISVTHDSGTGTFAWDNIPLETQRLLEYDAVTEATARKKTEAELAATQAKLRESIAQLSPKQLKAALSKFTVSPANKKAWQLTFTDASTARITFSYTTSAQWFPISGMAYTRENQLRAAATARVIQEQGGKGLSDHEVEFLSFETRVRLERHPGQKRIFTLNFPTTHSFAISEQIYSYQVKLAEASKQPADLGAVGANTFGYNADKTLRLNEMSFSSEEVSILESLVGRVPALQQEINQILIKK